ncbi:hypothetical protein AB0G85_29215 [Streptomyces sioyaensis]|uniref:hypothetical protein n=1 Tax=Streptomyces sioyaensis TaxID=67364 RepID=UPI0033F3FC28
MRVAEFAERLGPDDGHGHQAYLPEEPGDGVGLRTSRHSGKDSSADDVPDTNAEARRPRAHGHPADTGLQPIDHLLLFEHLSEPLAAWGFHSTGSRRSPSAVRPAWAQQALTPCTSWNCGTPLRERTPVQRTICALIWFSVRGGRHAHSL